MINNQYPDLADRTARQNLSDNFDVIDAWGPRKPSVHGFDKPPVDLQYWSKNSEPLYAEIGGSTRTSDLVAEQLKWSTEGRLTFIAGCSTAPYGGRYTTMLPPTTPRHMDAAIPGYATVSPHVAGGASTQISLLDKQPIRELGYSNDKPAIPLLVDADPSVSEYGIIHPATTGPLPPSSPQPTPGPPHPPSPQPTVEEDTFIPSPTQQYTLPLGFHVTYEQPYNQSHIKTSTDNIVSDRTKPDQVVYAVVQPKASRRAGATPRKKRHEGFDEPDEHALQLFKDEDCDSIKYGYTGTLPKAT